MPVIEVPEVGQVSFPDDMTDEQIVAAIENDILGKKRPVAPSLYKADIPVPSIAADARPGGQLLAIPGDRQIALADDSTQPPVTQAFPIERDARQTLEPKSDNLQTLEEGISAAVRQEPPAEERQVSLPRFGQQGTFARGVSEIVSGLGEFAINKPEELLASLYPPTAAAIALRYTPEIGKQWLEDMAKAYQGDREAAGRATAIFASIGGPIAAKKGIQAARRGALEARYEQEFKQQYASLVDQMARDRMDPNQRSPTTIMEPSTKVNLETPDPSARANLDVVPQGTHEQLVPESNKLFNEEIVNEAPKLEVSSAREKGETKTVDGDVLRVGEENRQAKSGLPVDEGGAGVRTQVEVEGGKSETQESGIQARLDELERQLGPRDEIDPNSPQGRPVMRPARILTNEETGLLKQLEEAKSEQNKPALNSEEQAAPEAPAEPSASEPVKPSAPSTDSTPPASEPTPAEAQSLFGPEALRSKSATAQGITPGRTNFEAVVDTVRKFIKRNFTVMGHMPREIWEGAKQVLEGATAEMNARVKHRGREFLNAVAEVYDLNKLRLSAGGTRQIPPAAVQLMDDYLKGRVMNAAIIPAPIRGVLDTMRAEIDGLSTQMINTLVAQQNRLRPGSAEWTALGQRIDTIRNNLDIYAHRSYRFFDSKGSAAEWWRDTPAGIRMAAEDAIINNAPPGMTRLEAQNVLRDWMSDLKEGSDFGGGGKLGAKDLSILMRRSQILPELRALIGEYRDPFINYAKSVTKMGDWVAKQRFLDEVRRVGMGRWLFEETAPRPAGFNTRIAAEGSESMSPLNGLRTSEEIAQAFKEYTSSKDAPEWLKFYYKVNAWSKMAATTHSWMTQARNLLSRPIMAMWAGHTDFTRMPTALRAIWNDFGGSDAMWQAYVQRMARLGVIGDTARAGELRAVLKDAAFQDATPASLTSFSVVRALRKGLYDTPKEIYRLSDDLGNIFGFENERAIQARINPTWTPEQLDAAAARITRELYPTYSETPRAVKGFRSLPATGPFVTFSYQVWRTAWNGLSRSFHEIRSSNPVERSVGLQRLGKQMTAITIGFALEEASKAAWNVSTQQLDDMRRMLPEWQKNAKWLFVGKDPKDSKLSAINVSYMDPFSYVTDPAVAIAAGLRSKEGFWETFQNMMVETARPWASEQMLVQAIIEARNGKSDAGREIWNATDDSSTRIAKGLAYIGERALMPGTLQRVQRRIIPAFRNEQPTFGRKLEPTAEIMRELTGTGIEQMDFKTALAFRAREFTDKDRASESIFHHVVSRTQTTTPQDLYDAYKASDERRYEIWKEMRGDFLAATRNGVSPEEAKKTMMARGVTRTDANHIAQGRYDPLPISDQTRKRARERNRTLPIVDIQRYRQEARQRGLE